MERWRIQHMQKLSGVRLCLPSIALLQFQMKLFLLYFIPLFLAQSLAFLVFFLWGNAYGYRRGAEDEGRRHIASI